MSEWMTVGSALESSPPSAKQTMLMTLADAAVSKWLAGELTLEQAEAETGDGWLRFQMLTKTPRDSPKFKNLWTLIDALCVRKETLNGDFYSKHGYLERDDIRLNDGRFIDDVDPETGQLVSILQFPVRYPPDSPNPVYPDRRDVRKEDRETERVVSEWFEDWNEPDAAEN